MRTLFDDGNLVVRTNDSGKVFVSSKENPGRQGEQPELRIGVRSCALHVTARECNWNPTSFNGLGGFAVTHMR